jgi:hypothetical protein
MSDTPTIRGFGTLHVGGQDRPFAVGTNQADVFCQLGSQRVDGKALPLTAYYELFSETSRLLGGPYRDFVYSALVAGAERAGHQVDYSHLTVGEWMDDPATDPKELSKPLSEMFAQLAAKAEAQAEREKKAQPTPKKAVKS